ncbi:MAG TPA: GNAT family protein [Trebonia sp.]|nr:GNAT family protein [Trebonia sp.]
MRLRSPSLRDLYAVRAGGSDPEAQRWLQWPDAHLVPAGQRERLLTVLPGGGGWPASHWEPHVVNLVAVDPVAGRLAGLVSANRETSEIGGWLVPEYRGRGLGVVLFAAGAELAHRHLGVAVVRAGAHPGNSASIGALTAAGFSPAAGPGTHVQPNGQVIPARWFDHRCGEPGYCGSGR